MIRPKSKLVLQIEDDDLWLDVKSIKRRKSFKTLNDAVVYLIREGLKVEAIQI